MFKYGGSFSWKKIYVIEKNGFTVTWTLKKSVWTRLMNYPIYCVRSNMPRIFMPGIINTVLIAWTQAVYILEPFCSVPRIYSYPRAGAYAALNWIILCDAFYSIIYTKPIYDMIIWISITYH